MSKLDLWTGKFGDNYTKRNSYTEEDINARVNLWTQIMNSILVTYDNDSDRLPRKILEVGAGCGQNIVAIDRLYKSGGLGGYHFGAVEPNQEARASLKQEPISIRKILDCDCTEIPLSDNGYDLVFTSGLLIHLPDGELEKAMKEINRLSSKFICAIEYFSPEPREIPYRGEQGALFTRDYGSLYMKMFSHLRVMSYGFMWKPVTKLDNLTWFLFEKCH